MHWLEPRTDFFVAQDVFDLDVGRDYLNRILTLGQDAARGFHHPDLKPNRFHRNPKYPVDRYMCLGLYWSPLDYRYYAHGPGAVTPHGIDPWLQELGARIVADCFPDFVGWRAEAVIVNYYTKGRKMSWHTDKEEPDKLAPVVGVNFGSSATFYFETPAGEEASVLIPGNSVYCFGGAARQMRHAVGAGRAKGQSFESAGLLGPGERLNLTLRKVWA